LSGKLLNEWMVDNMPEKLEQLYEGKAKRVYLTSDAELYIVECPRAFRRLFRNYYSLY
jgi:phosphoribosylaminoimidazole-succinocarboxamide synthase